MEDPIYSDASSLECPCGGRLKHTSPFIPIHTLHTHCSQFTLSPSLSLS